MRSALLYGLLTSANQMARVHPKTAGKGGHLALTSETESCPQAGEGGLEKSCGAWTINSPSGKCLAFTTGSLRKLLSDFDEIESRVGSEIDLHFVLNRPDRCPSAGANKYLSPGSSSFEPNDNNFYLVTVTSMKIFY